MSLEELRKEIDSVDKNILDLFEQRIQIAKRIGRYKKDNNLPIFHQNRESQILDRIAETASPENVEAAKVLFTTIMNIGKCIQQNEILEYNDVVKKIIEEINRERKVPKNSVIACQGVIGAYSQIACKEKFPLAEVKMLDEFEQVFDEVEQGKVDFGVLPLENSSAGPVDEVYELMKTRKFYINSTIKIKVEHCLVAKPGTRIEYISTVFSMNQALRQCSEYIKHNNLKANQFTNTAAAAKFVSESDEPYAAICSQECASLYGLNILKRNIQNINDNYTRFMVISKFLYPDERCDTMATSLNLSNSVGSLYNLLIKFAVNGVNLTRIKSMPTGNKNFDVVFYLDFSGNILEKQTLNLINDLSNELTEFKFLGNFRYE